MSVKTIRKDILKGNKEWNEKDGFVTIEFSVKRDIIEPLKQALMHNSPKPNNGTWCWSECETCREYHGDEYVHVEIVNDKFMNDRSEVINVLY